jgi:hypothetical protein
LKTAIGGLDMTSHHPRRLTPLIAAVALAGLSGCGLWRHSAPMVHARAVHPTSPSTASPDDADYAAAKAAIESRDYLAALDALQAARIRKADDVRVLNAFGVLYDKLGRFDLSGRYYEQARRLDPSSAIVAANIAWSAQMQHASVMLARAAPARSQPAPVAAPAPATTPRLVATGPGVLSLVPGKADATLLVINASGRGAAVAPVTVRLARLGWSPVESSVTPIWRADTTTVRYPEWRLAAAKTLARSLPGAVRLSSCIDCDRIELVLGVDASGWPVQKRA